MSPDEKFMRDALRQARKGLGKTSPNPAVGAVVVKDGRIVSAGYHRKAGLPHAEIEALAGLGNRAIGSTLYVTLEPCNHHGRTPPCTEAILRSGIKRVVVGMLDPNPDVKGGGCEFLRRKGIEIETGVLESECRRLNEAYIKHVTTKRPFVIIKSAMTLDGWTATGMGHSRWVTGEKSRRFVHRLRDRVDAIVVGVGTIIADDPLLTTRLNRGTGKDPVRIVLDTHLRIPSNARVLDHRSSADTIVVVGPDIETSALSRFEKKGVSTIACPVRQGRIDLTALMAILGDIPLTSLLVEGGAAVIGSFLREKLVDKFYLFMAPKILGGGDGIPMAAGPGASRMDQCMGLKHVKVRRLAEDLLIEGYPEMK